MRSRLFSNNDDLFVRNHAEVSYSAIRAYIKDVISKDES
jgi:hypothetical protein